MYEALLYEMYSGVEMYSGGIAFRIVIGHLSNTLAIFILWFIEIVVTSLETIEVKIHDVSCSLLLILIGSTLFRRFRC